MWARSRAAREVEEDVVDDTVISDEDEADGEDGESDFHPHHL